MKREALASYLGKRLYCRGKVQRYGNVGDNGPITMCIESATIEPPDAPDFYFEHVWVSRGVTADFEQRYPVGTWVSFTAKVWEYKDGKGYGLAFPEEMCRSYS